jgi:hypothetical protein
VKKITRLALHFFIISTLVFTGSVAHSAVLSGSVPTKTLNNKGVTWTYPATFKIPKSGCKNLKVQFNIKIPAKGIMSTFNISDDFGGNIGTTSAVRLFDGKKGTKKIKICAEPWVSDFGDEYVGVEKGTFDILSETIDGSGQSDFYSMSTGTIKLI